MTKLTVERISAISLSYAKKSSGEGTAVRVIPDLMLHQVAVWPDSMSKVKEMLQTAIGSDSKITPMLIGKGTDAAAIWIEPLKFWLLNSTLPTLSPESAVTHDLSHAYVHLVISGDKATDHLSKHLPLDLRDRSFPLGATAASAIHHVPVRLWREDDGYHLLIPRGFAQSLYEMIAPH